MPAKLSLAGAAIALALAAPPAETTQPDEALAAEARLAAKHPGLFKRSGKTLRIGGNSFTDQGRCRDEDPSCVRYRADAVYGAYVGVWTDYYEQSEYLLVDPNGFSTTIGSPPVSSPSGKRFFVLYEDPNMWNPLQGAAVWTWAGLQRLRVVDQALVEVSRFVAWRGDACVEVVGRRRYPAPEQPMWLAEQNGDWQMTATRAPICKD